EEEQEDARREEEQEDARREEEQEDARRNNGDEPGEIPDASESSAPDLPVRSVPGIGPTYADRLADADVTTLEELIALDASRVASITGAGEGRVERWFDAIGHRNSEPTRKDRDESTGEGRDR
ncbi:MAG: helix-hairpin-helix domain-containing protein, partial [Haloferacaceae archaeon]